MVQRVAKKYSPILAAMWETVQGLHAAGVITTEQLHRHARVPQADRVDFAPERLLRIRKAQRLSQAAFAELLNVSASSVRQWERGAKVPSGASLRLLQLVEKNGIEMLLELSA